MKVDTPDQTPGASNRVDVQGGRGQDEPCPRVPVPTELPLSLRVSDTTSGAVETTYPERGFCVHSAGPEGDVKESVGSGVTPEVRVIHPLPVVTGPPFLEKRSTRGSLRPFTLTNHLPVGATRGVGS